MARPSSEDHILAIIDKHFPTGRSALLLGRGDDCAEFIAAGPQALSTDLFIEDVHFRRSYFLPEEAGHKALAVNLSDLASAGAVPTAFSMGLIVPPDLDADWLDAMFGGMAALARKHNVELSGGDISTGDKLGLCITVWGGGVPAMGEPALGTESKVLLRRGARAGQLLFTLGQDRGAGAGSNGGYCALGLARLGLQKLESNGRGALESWPGACSALLLPQPQLAGGQLLARMVAERGGIQASPVFLMDISDGLARDLPRLLKGQGDAGLGADLGFAADTLHPELHKAGAELGNPLFALETALSGGDDYLLLGAADESFLAEAGALLAATKSDIRIDVLGRVSAKAGLRWRGRPLQEVMQTRAFDHFE